MTQYRILESPAGYRLQRKRWFLPWRTIVTMRDRTGAELALRHYRDSWQATT